MSQLEKIWELEVEVELLDKYNEELKEKYEYLENNQINKEIDKISLQLEIDKSDMEMKMYNIRILEKSLKEKKYEFDRVNSELYGGKVTDLKQLEYLSNEKSDLEKDIDELESNILLEMESESKLEEEYDNRLKDLKELENEKLMLYREIESKISDMEKNIEKQEDSISQIEELINSDILHRYNDIKSRRKIAVVRVEDGVCRGCNMMLPTKVWHDIRVNDEIHYCDNCGRILYYETK